MGVMILSAGAEALSLGAVVPFLAVISNPAFLWSYPWTRSYAEYIGITNSASLLLPAVLFFGIAAILAMSLRIFNLWLNGRLAASIGSDLSCAAYLRTLCQTYEIQKLQNSGDLIDSLTLRVNGTVVAITSLLQLVTGSLVSLFLIAGLLLIEWKIACAFAGIFIAAYAVFAGTVKHRLVSNGRNAETYAQQQVRAIQDGLGGIREIILDGSQSVFLSRYTELDSEQRLLQAENYFLSGFPRFALEGVGLIGIAALGAILVLRQNGPISVLPLLGSLALGVQRLLPSLQQSYLGWSIFEGYSSNVQTVLDLVCKPLQSSSNSEINACGLVSQLKLENLHYYLPGSSTALLSGLTFSIEAGDCVGIIGPTGSGKSTLADLLMALLPPTSGKLLIDGVDLADQHNSEFIPAWRRSIAHVPQTVYLVDGSFAENIAFGIPSGLIDMDMVRNSAKQAQISSFIESRPRGYEGLIGERGVQLSGGQRQRIGIARALYKGSDILFLDEATSALDPVTEEKVVAALMSGRRTKTIVMIAHRYSTLSQCNKIIRLEDGCLADIGPPSCVIPTC